MQKNLFPAIIGHHTFGPRRTNSYLISLGINLSVVSQVRLDSKPRKQLLWVEIHLLGRFIRNSMLIAAQSVIDEPIFACINCHILAKYKIRRE
jgi:hypothetical protein